MYAITDGLHIGLQVAEYKTNHEFDAMFDTVVVVRVTLDEHIPFGTCKTIYLDNLLKGFKTKTTLVRPFSFLSSGLLVFCA